MGDPPLHRLRVINWQCRVQRAQLLGDRARYPPKAGRARSRPNHQVHAETRILRMRQVTGKSRRAVQPVLLNVLHQSHDGDPWRFGILAAELEALAYRVLTWEKALGETLVDDGGLLAHTRVVLVEKAAAHQRNAHRPKITCRRRVNVGLNERFTSAGRVAVNPDNSPRQHAR